MVSLGLSHSEVLCFNAKFYSKRIERLSSFLFLLSLMPGKSSVCCKLFVPLQLLFPKYCILRPSFQWVTMVQRNVYKESGWKKRKGRAIFTSIVTGFKINGYFMIIEDVKMQ